MTTPSGNPFVFPGMNWGANADQAGANPILQSLEMMRQAWTSLGAPAGQMATPPILSADDLERRIVELRSVENWLRLNLNILEGSIQALEVQRATMATLQAFANMGSQAAGATAAPGQPSPLDVVLGLKPTGADSVQRPAAPDAPAAQSGAAPADAQTPPEAAPGQAGGSPQQAWWNMLQHQFNQLAGAAAATMQTAAPAASPTAAGTSTPAAKKAARKRASKSTTQSNKPQS